MHLALSFLGTGPYNSTTYVWNDRHCQTHLFPEAVPSFFPVDRHLVLATDAAKKEWGAVLRERIDYERLPIPVGESENELWDVFITIAETVPEGAEITIDVTHGFRSQPLLALAVGLYLQAVKGVSIERVVYGAYEARSGDGPDDTSPVFDLTAFVDLATWATAARLSMQYGDATPLQRILHDLHGKTYRQEHGYQSRSLYDVGTSLDGLMQALATVRPEQAIEQAQALPDSLSQVEDDIEQLPQSRPLKALLDPFRERFEPMGSDDLFSESGFKAQAQMLRFYLETDQYQQAITLAREAIVSKECVVRDRDPSEKGDRETTEDELNKLAERDKEESIADEEKDILATLWGNIRRVRNDVNHAGMNEDPLSANDVAKQIKDYTRDTATFITDVPS